MKELLDMNRIPQHIAIIMDGNGRWATDRGLDRTFGHKEGLETVKKITAECARLGVKYLTLYTFSTENWNRPAYEIEALMGLVLGFVEIELFTENNIRFRMIGDLKRLPDSVQDKIRYMEDLTKDGERMTVIMAFLPGTEGEGVADVLFGDYDFTGTLPMTWIRDLEQVDNKFS